MTEKQLLVSISINDFSEYIEVSKKRMAKPYIKGKCRLPKKYQTNDYVFDKKNRLIEKLTGKVVIANTKTVGKPRLEKVNGQNIYNGTANPIMRSALINKIHNYFKPLLKDVVIPKDIEYYPLCLELIFYVKDQGKFNVDNDNKWIWRKCIQDTITELGIWPDDNVNVISRNEEETILISDEEEQKLIINIYGQSRNS